MSEMPNGARLFWFVVVAAAGATMVASVGGLVLSAGHLPLHVWISLGAFAIIAFVSERLAIPLVTFDDEPASHSIGSVAGIAAIIVLPLYAAIPLLPLAIAWSQRRRSPMKGIFNVAHSALSIAAAGIVFHLAGAVPALYAHSPAAAFRALGAMLALSVVYYAVSSGLVATMVGLASGQRITDVYHANHLHTVLQEATAIGLGLILGGFWLYNAAFAPFVALPVAMAYFSIDTFVRIQQETRNAVLEMAKSIDLRDSATRLHSKRVAKLSVALAKELDLSHEQVANIELSALVHDIGKIGIPNEILNKPGKLTSEERSQMEAHPVIGYEMLRHYKQFRKGLGIVRWHHERWDGAGYPDRIPGPQVPLEARIVSIADAFEAMTADRPYRKAMSSAVAYGRLEDSSGTQFDPNLVAPFKTALLACGEMNSSPQSVTGDELKAPIQQSSAQPVLIPLQPKPSPIASPESRAIRPVRPRQAHNIRRIPAANSCHVLLPARREASG